MIRVAIIEDNEAYRKSLEALISKTNDLEIVYTAHNCKAIAETIAIILPDVLIMDIEMPGVSGIEGVKLIKQHSPDTNIIMLTVFEDEANIFESIKAGAIGYLLKKDPPENILNAIRQVHRGESIMNGKIARKVLQFFNTKEVVRPSLEEYKLTRREKEILELLMNGLSYKEIASQCTITMDTMFSHIRKIYTKLNVHSRSEIAARFR